MNERDERTLDTARRRADTQIGYAAGAAAGSSAEAQQRRPSRLTTPEFVVTEFLRSTHQNAPEHETDRKLDESAARAMGGLRAASATPTLVDFPPRPGSGGATHGDRSPGAVAERPSCERAATAITPAPAYLPIQAQQPARADLATPLFRVEALRAYESGLPVASALHTDGLGAWLLFLALVCACAVALGVGAVGQIDLTARARGVLETPAGTALLSAESTGIVRRVAVALGTPVQPGQLLLEIDSREARAQLLRTTQALESLETRFGEEQRALDRLHAKGMALLAKRAKVARRRIGTHDKDQSRLRTREKAYLDLMAEGITAPAEFDQLVDQLSGLTRSRLALLDQHFELETQMAELERRAADRRAAREIELARAKAERDAAQLVVDATSVRAPSAGRVESVLVKEGEAVQPGLALVQIVPEGVPRQVVVFVAERDRAFISPGRIARVELDRLPRAEFGTLSAKVLRVANEVAPQVELARYLESDASREALVRVDLELENPRLSPFQLGHLESGARLTARLPLRKRRLIALLFDPLRHWIDD